MISIDLDEGENSSSLKSAIIEANKFIESQFLFSKRRRLSEEIYAHIFIQDLSQQKISWVASGVGSQSIREDFRCSSSVNDCHAETLAIRAFRLFVLDQIKNEQVDFFEEKSDNFPFEFKKNQKLILYTSLLPCGDCSKDEQGNLQSKSKAYHSAMLFKQGISWDDNSILDKPGCLRIKPVRKDLPKEQLSLSLSCTDKLALSQLSGIQGNYLYNLIGPVYLDQLVVEGNSNILPWSKEALDIESRFGFNKKILFWKKKKIGFFQYHKMELTINQFLKDEVEKFSEKQKQKQSSALGVFFSSKEKKYIADFISPSTGLREGATIKQKDNEKCISFFSSWKVSKEISIVIQKIKKLNEIAKELNVDLSSRSELKLVSFPYVVLRNQIKRQLGMKDYQENTEKQ